MIIKINDKKFGEQNYEYEIFVNERKADLIVKNKEILLENLSKHDIVEIIAKNIVLSSKYGMVLSSVYWIIALLSGFGESNVFGKPFDAVLKLQLITSDSLTIETNKIWENKPFCIDNQSVFILKNEFISPPKYRRRWCMSVVVPINILILLVCMLFIMSGLIWSSSSVKYFVVIPIVCIVCWNIYCYKVLHTLKKMSE